MENYQNQYGAVEQRRTDEYLNPGTTTTTTDAYGNPIETHDRHKLGGMLHRSGSSSSSSSSEDDGHGGRRKKEKGLKDKIKEKLPGHHKKADHATSTTVPGGYAPAATTTHHDQEHKGIMDKIKDKLPGSHHH